MGVCAHGIEIRVVFSGKIVGGRFDSAKAVGFCSEVEELVKVNLSLFPVGWEHISKGVGRKTAFQPGLNARGGLEWCLRGGKHSYDRGCASRFEKIAT